MSKPSMEQVIQQLRQLNVMPIQVDRMVSAALPFIHRSEARKISAEQVMFEALTHHLAIVAAQCTATYHLHGKEAEGLVSMLNDYRLKTMWQFRITDRPDGRGKILETRTTFNPSPRNKWRSVHTEFIDFEAPALS